MLGVFLISPHIYSSLLRLEISTVTLKLYLCSIQFQGAGCSLGQLQKFKVILSSLRYLAIDMASFGYLRGSFQGFSQNFKFNSELTLNIILQCLEHITWEWSKGNHISHHTTTVNLVIPVLSLIQPLILQIDLMHFLVKIKTLRPQVLSQWLLHLSVLGELAVTSLF